MLRSKIFSGYLMCKRASTEREGVRVLIEDKYLQVSVCDATFV
jgi:hypothetical protein